MSLDKYLSAFHTLKVNRRGEYFSPHKPCMLLSVTELAVAGKLERNRIDFAPPLLERYIALFNAVRGPRDHPNPYFPFFHLQGDRFWHLKPKRGRAVHLAALSTARSARDIIANVAYAYLDRELHNFLLDPDARNQLRSALLSWFPVDSDGIRQHLRAHEESNVYESLLRERLVEKNAAHPPVQYDSQVRSTAFRRVVTEAYDYRCAASGWRIILPDDTVMVQAAHLVPFSVSRNDDPRNGMALSPSYHWALDQWILAPGPDYRWHVSKVLDERFADNKPLLGLSGKKILLPRDERFWPCQEYLEWRLAHLRAE
jgi:putative restriction endonuclease